MILLFAMILAQASTVTLDANTIILAVISLIGTTVTGYLALRMASLAQNAKEAKESLKEVHTAVNSAKSLLESKLEDVTKKNLELEKRIATTDEARRGAEMAKAVSEVKPVLVTPAIVASPAIMASPAVAVAAPTPITPVITESKATAPAGAPLDPSPLKQAITDLTEAAKDTVKAADNTLQKVAVADKTVEKVVKGQHS